MSQVALSAQLDWKLTCRQKCRCGLRIGESIASNHAQIQFLRRLPDEAPAFCCFPLEAIEDGVVEDKSLPVERIFKVGRQYVAAR